MHKERNIQDFPAGPEVKNPPANAADTGSSPWSGRIAHASEQRVAGATIPKPVLQSPGATEMPQK